MIDFETAFDESLQIAADSWYGTFNELKLHRQTSHGRRRAKIWQKQGLYIISSDFEINA